MNKEKLIKKIRALLAKADISRGATPGEASSALAKAQELMTAHGLDAVEVETGERLYDIDHEAVVTDSEVMRDYDLALSHVLMACFGVRVLFGRARFDRKSYHSLILVGEALDRELAKIAIPILARAMDSHPDNYDLERCRSFYAGLEHGYVHASEQGRLRAQAIASRASVERFALVLVDKENAISAYMDATFKLKPPIEEPPVKGDPTAFFEGVSRGRELDLSAEKKLNAPPRPSSRPSTSFEDFQRELLRRMADFDRTFRED